MVSYFNKGTVYDYEDGKQMMVIAHKNLKYCEECNCLNGMITINFKDFPLFDVYECFGDHMADIIEDLEMPMTPTLKGE